MNLVFFTHPDFLGHQSMPRFAKMLADGMKARGHTVNVWSPHPVFFKFHSHPLIRKWLGYIDQYVLFPREISQRLSVNTENTLFVFTDQALGPWVPYVSSHPHVIHCHDFMALASALGEFPENTTGWTGKQYQKLIQRGFSQGKNFISVSYKTKQDLERYLLRPPQSSEVVYNGFHQPFFPYDPVEARSALGKRISLDLSAGYILHVGGNTWYKNREGVIDIYNAWRPTAGRKLPLLMVGERPTQALLLKQSESQYSWDIHWLPNIEDEFVRLSYSGASVFLFPSLGEGFGWPIAEAMASGAPVITTGEAPMTEVAGTAGFFIARRPAKAGEVAHWAEEASLTVNKVLNLAPAERKSVIEAGLENAKRFDTQATLDKIEKIYQTILDTGSTIKK